METIPVPLNIESTSIFEEYIGCDPEVVSLTPPKRNCTEKGQKLPEVELQKNLARHNLTVVIGHSVMEILFVSILDKLLITSIWEGHALFAIVLHGPGNAVGGQSSDAIILEVKAEKQQKRML